MNISIPKETIEFLSKLEKNNNRDWFNDHKKEFKSIETEVKKIYNTVFENLKEHDDVDKVKLFRIYRDVRFSKNKLPYKMTPFTRITYGDLCNARHFGGQ